MLASCRAELNLASLAASKSSVTIPNEAFRARALAQMYTLDMQLLQLATACNIVANLPSIIFCTITQQPPASAPPVQG